MIKAIIDKGEAVVAASGTPQAIVAELGLMVGHMHRVIKSRNPRSAGVFRLAVQAVVANDSPIWHVNTAPDLAIVMETPVKDAE